MAHYFDTSALVKLVVAEPESDALRRWLQETDGDWVSGDVARTELMRTVRSTAPELLVRVREVLDSLTLIEITTGIFETAGRLEPELPRTLDAVHLAAALALGDELESVVTYDERLAAAAQANGVTSIGPS